MVSKTVKFLQGEWLPKSGDRREYCFNYSIIGTDLVGQPDEATLTRMGRIVIGISRSLETTWRLDSEDLVKVLFEYAKRHIQGKVLDSTLSEYEEIQLSSYNVPSECPFDPSRIEYSVGKEFQFGEAKQVLPDRIDTTEQASKIIDLRDNVNALFAEKFQGSLLNLPQERGLLELFRTCGNQEEFAYRVASLSALVTAIDTGYIKSIVPVTKNEGTLDIFGKFLRENFPISQTNQVMDTFQAFNRLRRMYPIHTDRANGVMNALAYFGLEYPVEEFHVAWSKLLKFYSDSLNILLAMIKSKT